MKTSLIRILGFLSLFAGISILTGCVVVGQQRFDFNYETGEVTFTYHDLRSKKISEEKDYSIQKDWELLQKLVEGESKEYDVAVAVATHRELFQENKHLSGRKTVRIKCPKCFPAKDMVLSFLHEKEWRFETINDEIILFSPPGKKVVSANGKILQTQKNSMVVWPVETTRFSYTIEDKNFGGDSLLSFYLKS
jgi:hypothetical protein